jgi:histidine ammonia-lyase
LETIETLLEMLRRGVHPIIPEKGSVGASGDLAPLAHMALPMVGLGEAVYRGQRLPGRQAMEAAEIPLLRLQAKEGLALLNGTQFMTALGCLALLKAENLCRHADLIGTMSAEGLLGTPVAWDARIQLARGMPGQIRVAENLRKLMEGSEIRESHLDCSRVQDAYSVRCMPQVHGAVRDAVAYVRSVLEIEINAATDNPLVFADDETVLSGGNFHGQPIAVAMDLLGQVMAQLANISERRIEYLCDPDMSDMAGFLTEHGGLNSGFMIAQVTAASLVSENKVLAHPAAVDSIPTSANKEDYVSMGATAARQARDIVENTETVLAIELLCACQGLDLRRPLQPGAATRAARDLVRRHIPHLDQDRLMYPDIEAAKRLIRDGELLQEVAPLVGEL